MATAGGTGQGQRAGSTPHPPARPLHAAATMNTRLAPCALLLLALPACATDPDPCAEAAARVAVCFPDLAVASSSATCDPELAEVIAGSSCEDLAARDGKADDWTCAWMPWLCLGGGGAGGGSTQPGIEVAVMECGGDFAGSCPYVQSATCGLVTLHDSTGDEVARVFSNGNGRATFFGLAEGAYQVRVHKRDGALARMQPDPLSSATTSASQALTVGGRTTPWADFNLVPGSQQAITQCADADGGITVRDSAGVEVDRREVEWEWLIELERDGEVLERTRPLFLHHEASSSGVDENVVSFRLLRVGTYTVRYVRMEIPSYARRINPDYAQLRRLYSADVAPIEHNLRVSNAQRGRTVTIDRTLTDPLR